MCLGNVYLCNMKHKLWIILLCSVLPACQRAPERPMPLQMTYAQRELEMRKDGVFALYLLSELEDSIGQMPTFIQVHYKAMKSEAERMVQLQSSTLHEITDFNTAIRQRDSIYQCQLAEERAAYEMQMKQYRDDLYRIRTQQRMAVLFVVLMGIIITCYLGIRFHRRRSRQKTIERLMPSDIEQRLMQLADRGQQPSAEDWDSLRRFILQSHPRWEDKLRYARNPLNSQDLQLCLLSTTNLRPKQIATLLNVSQQNLRNLRVRLYTKATGLPCSSVDAFLDWVK